MITCLEVINILIKTASISELKSFILINNILYRYETITQLSKGIISKKPRRDTLNLTEEKQVELLNLLQEKISICNEYETAVVEKVMSIIEIFLIKRR